MSTPAISPSDIELMSKLPPSRAQAFQRFMEDMDLAHLAAGSPYGDGSLWKTTGAAAWFDYFEEGYSGSAALAEDGIQRPGQTL